MTRLSTTQIYSNASAAIGAKQSEIARLQNQLSTGKRIASLADDPAAAAGASVIRSGLAANTQYEANRQVATERLSSAESTLGVVSDTLQSVRELLVSAGNGGFSDADRATVAGQLKEHLATLIGLANSGDGRGGYLFGGNRETTPPFVPDGARVDYAGDDGRRTIDVSSSRSIDASFSGADVFARIKSGNGVFTTAALGANAGSGVIDGGRITDPAALTGDRYEIRFHSTAGAVTYDVWNASTSTAVSVGQAYSAPAAIALPGLSAGVTGTPSDGDIFSVEPSVNRDLFATIQSAIDLLSTKGAPAATFTNGLRGALTDLDRGLSNVSDYRGAAGARLVELDRAGLLSSQRDVDLQGTLSKLEDVDYAKTISEFTVAQTALQAALDSYARISKVTLFDYIR